jgi:hypothetical protein
MNVEWPLEVKGSGSGLSMPGIASAAPRPNGPVLRSVEYQKPKRSTCFAAIEGNIRSHMGLIREGQKVPYFSFPTKLNGPVMEASNDTLYRSLCSGPVAHDCRRRGIIKLCIRTIWQV